jgi:hypothetical protein
MARRCQVFSSGKIIVEMQIEAQNSKDIIGVFWDLLVGRKPVNVIGVGP